MGKNIIIGNRLYLEGGIMERNRKRISILSLILFLVLLGLQVFVVVRNSFADDMQYVFVEKEFDENIEIIEDENNIIEISKLRNEYDNEDITGYVSVLGTNINEPVLKYTNNDYYLHHDSYGRYAINGSIFQDYRINLDDRKVLIYGHSSVYDNISFNELEKFYNKDYYDGHKYIELVTENNKYKYEIFSVYVETKDFTYMNLKISDDIYNDYLKKYKSNSLYETGVDVTDNDEVIILQTCSNNDRYAKYQKKYLLVIGKKIYKEV